MTGFRLHEDANFHYETLRSMGTIRYYGSDLTEQLNLMPNIKVNDFDSWYDAWAGLAKQVLSTIDENSLDKYSPVTVRNIYLRASHYYFVAEFFLHKNWDDERSLDAYSKWREYYDIANAHFENPGRFFKVKADFGEMPCYLYRTVKASATNLRPTFILGGGFDSNMEELMHDFGFDMLERGYNVLIYEGPGQPSFLRDQRVGFIHDWERAVTPIVDALLEVDFVDKGKIALLGMSLGGYLAARAAAFEPRLCAVVCIDGVQSFYDCMLKMVPDIKLALSTQDETTFNQIFAKYGEKTANSNQRWFHDHFLLSMQEKNAFKAFERVQKMTMAGIAQQIKMPALIGEAEEDIFFSGQPQELADGIGSNATLVRFTGENAAAAHCASGAFVYQNQIISEWFAKVIGEKS